jgi:hypothetical protein
MFCVLVLSIVFCFLKDCFEYGGVDLIVLAKFILKLLHRIVFIISYHSQFLDIGLCRNTPHNKYSFSTVVAHVTLRLAQVACKKCNIQVVYMHTR